jgi:hypothetical protein
VSGMLQGLTVAALVTACVLYSTWRLLSAGLRMRVMDALARVPGIGTARWFEAARAHAVSKFAAGCGSCAPGATSAASRKQTPGGLRRS